MAQIGSRLHKPNVTLPAGIVQIGRTNIRSDRRALPNAQQIGDLTIAVIGGAPSNLRDVATVQDSIAEQRSFQRLNGTPALGISINSQPDANVVSRPPWASTRRSPTSRRATGHAVRVVLDKEGFILEAVHALEHGAVRRGPGHLVIFLFLHFVALPLTVAISLPISVLTLFAHPNYSLNVMTLGGLALAVGLIDRRRDRGREHLPAHGMEAGGQSGRRGRHRDLQRGPRVVDRRHHRVHPARADPGLQGLLFTPFAVMVMVAVGLAPGGVDYRADAHDRVDAAQAEPTGTDRRGRRLRPFVRRFDRFYERFAAWYKARSTWALDRASIIFTLAGGIFAAT